MFVEGHATCLWFVGSLFGLGYLLGCLGSHNIVFLRFFGAMWSLFCGHLLSLYFIFYVMTRWFLYLFFFVGCGEHGRVVETGWERCFLQCFCYKFCISLWMVLDTTWLQFLCVVISRLSMLLIFQIRHYPCSGSSCMCLVFINWFAHRAWGCSLWVGYVAGIIFWCWIPLRYGWLDELAFSVDVIFNLVGLSVGLKQSVWLLF